MQEKDSTSRGIASQMQRCSHCLSAIFGLHSIPANYAAASKLSNFGAVSHSLCIGIVRKASDAHQA